MAAASYLSALDRGRELLPRRTAAFALAVAVHLLLILMLLRLAPPTTREAPRPPIVVRLLPEPKPVPASRPNPTPVKRAARGGAGRPAPKAPAPPPPPPAPAGPLNMMVVTRDVFAAADIGALPRRRPGVQAGGIGAGEGAGSGNADGAGEGPGGATLYNAEWYTRPTHAELATYLPNSAMQPGWGMIVCRTVPNYRVEDCRELGDSPAGSGLARALRRASWQFRVLPPRVGGRALVGAWVRIRFDFTVDKEPR